jgi:hypothetical protein
MTASLGTTRFLVSSLVEPTFPLNPPPLSLLPWLCLWQICTLSAATRQYLRTPFPVSFPTTIPCARSLMRCKVRRSLHPKFQSCYLNCVSISLIVLTSSIIMNLLPLSSGLELLDVTVRIALVLLTTPFSSAPISVPVLSFVLLPLMTVARR